MAWSFPHQLQPQSIIRSVSEILSVPGFFSGDLKFQSNDFPCLVNLYFVFLGTDVTPATFETPEVHPGDSSVLTKPKFTPKSLDEGKRLSARVFL